MGGEGVASGDEKVEYKKRRRTKERRKVGRLAEMEEEKVESGQKKRQIEEEL